MKRNVWHKVEAYPDILVGQYVVPNFVSNSVSIKLNENEFVIYSPGANLLESWPEKDNPKLKLHIILPNAYHHLGIQAWIAHFQDVALYASQKAKSQLIKKQAFSQVTDINEISEYASKFEDSFKLSLPAGHRAGDIWISHQNTQSETLWITCDSFLNYERLSNQTVARFMQKLLGAAPGLKISQVVKWFILDDRKHFKQWASKQVQKEQPVALIPSHGEILVDDKLPDRLLDLLQTRL